jgi:hypothetical protein
MIDFTKINQEWGYAPVQPAGPSAPAGQPGQPTGPNTQPKTSINKAPTTTTGGGTPMANTSTTGNFIYPNEWDNLGDQWGQMASGNYTNPGMD